MVINSVTTVDVEITDRVKKNENDFDWDEAVVYFMMTDRFFDGNESNNTASGLQIHTETTLDCIMVEILPV